MPIYEYRCKDCGKVSEFLEGVSQDQPEIRCSHCGGKNLSKIFSKSFALAGQRSIDSPAGKTCCGRDEPCEIPPLL